MSDELKPCPFCNGEGVIYEYSTVETCPCSMRPAQPAEAEGVDFGFDDRSVKVSQEAYSIFLEREQHHLAALSAVTAERDRLREAAELLSRLRGLINCTPENDIDKIPVWISTKHPTIERIDALLVAMAAKEA
ncbi:hypothetical protein [Stutzerimonas nitrititolerans]|uniref:hypothetical protein n=1 Tax=Stutzerimonas nitrititolerans TaxID=2482751 RepID=UPI0028ACC7D6|nr:hypothetical protein [Stutzerimonas nitrititolerans]